MRLLHVMPHHGDLFHFSRTPLNILQLSAISEVNGDVTAIEQNRRERDNRT